MPSYCGIWAIALQRAERHRVLPNYCNHSDNARSLRVVGAGCLEPSLCIFGQNGNIRQRISRFFYVFRKLFHVKQFAFFCHFCRSIPLFSWRFTVAADVIFARFCRIQKHGTLSLFALVEHKCGGARLACGSSDLRVCMLQGCADVRDCSLKSIWGGIVSRTQTNVKQIAAQVSFAEYHNGTGKCVRRGADMVIHENGAQSSIAFCAQRKSLSDERKTT